MEARQQQAHLELAVDALLDQCIDVLRSLREFKAGILQCHIPALHRRTAVCVHTRQPPSGDLVESMQMQRLAGK